MSATAEAGFRKTSPALELLRVAGLLAVFAVQLCLGSRIAKAPRLDYDFTQPLWLDEFHTLEVVKQPRVGELLRKLSEGGDVAPPGLHLAIWTISKVTRFSDEVLLRSFTCAVGLIGFVAMYFLLRRQFPWRVSFVAVMGMWCSSTLLIEQMFNGRFYSFWFGTAAVLCLLLSLRGAGFWQHACVAAVAAFLCSIHYFAILSLGLITVCQFCCNFRDPRQRRLAATAAAAGVLALIAMLPLYFRQRAAIAGTWIDPPTLRGSTAFLGIFGLTYAMTFPVLAYGFGELLGLRSDYAAPGNGLEFNIYGGACGLLLLPAVIIVFSYLIQPAEVARYALPAVLAYAPLIALIVFRSHGAVLLGMATVFFMVGLRGPILASEIRPDYREAAPLAKRASIERPLVVHLRHVAYPLMRYTGADPDVIRISYLYRGDKLNRFDALEQTVARRMAELFPLPKTLEPNDLASLKEFDLLVPPGEERRYTGWTAEPLNLVVESLRAYRMKRAP